MSPVFEAIGLSKRFGGVLAIDALDLAVPAGEVHALIGPNGAGKTTFLNLVSGVYRPTTGDLRFEGRSIVALRPHRVAARGIARTFQHPSLFEGLNVMGNVMAGAFLRQPADFWGALLGLPAARGAAAVAEAEAIRWLEFVGLGHQVAAPVSRLTPAERRLLELARALASRPRLLLLDEPFAGMTVEEAEGLRRCIAALRDRGLTVLLIDHNMPVVMRIADRVTVIAFGRKIAEGTPTEIQESAVVGEAYLGHAGAAARA